DVSRRPQITRSRVPAPGRRGTMIPPWGARRRRPRPPAPRQPRSRARMTSPHDDAPRPPSWAAPAGPGAQPPETVPQPGPPVAPPPPPSGWGQQPPGGQGSWGPAAPPPPGLSWRPQALQPGIIPLRPLGMGEIYDGAFREVSDNPRGMFGI